MAYFAYHLFLCVFFASFKLSQPLRAGSGIDILKIMACTQGECVWRVPGGWGLGYWGGCWKLTTSDGASRLMFIPCWSINWRRRWKLPGLMSNLADKMGCQATAVQQQAYCLQTKMLVPQTAFQYPKESFFGWYLVWQICLFHPLIFQWNNQTSTYGNFGCKIIFKLAFSYGSSIKKRRKGQYMFPPHQNTRNVRF